MTLHNLSGGRQSIKKLSQSENIVGFERLKFYDPQWKSSIKEYRTFIKDAMSKENLHKPILTNYLSEQKLKKGIVDELTKNKGIEVQIHTGKHYLEVILTIFKRCGRRLTPH